MPTVRIPDLLEAILKATADEAAAKARIARIRASLEAEARARFAAEGAAPSWKTAKLGTVRYDAPGEWAAKVADPEAFGSYVAEHYPTEAVAVLELDATGLEAALEALSFAGVDVRARVDVRSSFAGKFLEELIVDVEETPADDGGTDRTFTVVDPATGAVVDGLTGNRTPGKLVVSLDRTRRSEALSEADEEAARLIDEATDDTEVPAIPVEVLDARRRELEELTLEELKAIATRIELGSSGTKAALAERIARAEALGAGAANVVAAAIAKAEAPLDGIPEAQREPTTIPADLGGLKVDQLRRVARRHGRPISGTKADLLDRLADVLDAELAS